MKRPEKIENWLIEAADLMARTGCTLIEAAALLDQPVESDVCDAIVRRKSFYRLLWEARHRHFNALANDPNFKKDTVVGRLLSLSQRLEDQGDYDKAAEAILKAAKVAGFVGVEGQVNVFGDLSQADLDKIRDDLVRAKASVTNQRPN